MMTACWLGLWLETKFISNDSNEGTTFMCWYCEEVKDGKTPETNNGGRQYYPYGQRTKETMD